MDAHIASKRTLASVAALLLIGATIGLTQPFEQTVTRATVCVNRNGQLRMPTSGATGCAANERLVQWVVDGEVTDVSVGPGLVATRQGGLVNLEVDPSILECEQCNGGKVFAGYNDGPGEVPNGDPPTHEPQEIAKLEVPEGDYAIFAKMQLSNLLEAKDSLVWCRLTAGADSDEALVVLENTKEQGVEASWGGASRHVMKLQVVHRFESPGTVIVSCADGFDLAEFNGGQFLDLNTVFTHLKIIAMKVSSISNIVLE
jgi:hypothetical protein